MHDTTSYRRIAAEEAWAPPELLERYRRLLADEPGIDDPGFRSLWGFYGGQSPRATDLVRRIQDLGELRLREMDESGIARQIVFLTAPGVQVFDAPTATSLARSANDELAEAVRRHPDRFTGLAAVAPQDPRGAGQELERAVKRLGLKGAVVNSHTRGEYLDDPKFWEIFEAAEALDVPIYLHPTTPSPAMIRPFLERGLDGAIYGFAVETGLHMLRIVVSGALDRFPRLRMVVGHLGEGLPYFLFRIDFMHRHMVAAKRYASVKPLERKPSDYLKERFHYTTSGMQWAPAILFALSVLGSDRVLYAMDYPYQFVPEEVKVTDELPIAEADKRKLYELNAARVFGL
jgi:2,3-dihydroxybenzoate decarboxylase